MPGQALAAVATLLSFAAHGNRIELRLDRGAAELVWISDSTFRFRRALENALPEVAAPDREPVHVALDDMPGAVRMRSKYMEVSLQKRGLLVRVRRLDGTPLVADLSEPRPGDAPVSGGVAWDRQAPPGTRFYGLGPRADDVLDLRGKVVAAEVPFLITSAGYGEYHPGGGPYRFDFSAADRYRIEAPRIDYYFYYGPTPKEIFEEHNGVRGPSGKFQVSAGPAGSWSALRNSLLRLVSGAMSAALDPAFDLAPFAAAPAELSQRARQLGSLVPEVAAGSVGLSDFREQLASFFEIYAMEIRDHGHPVWHPLPFEFPNDPECALHADEFMLGDEMLVAPVYQPGGKRSVYLPQGVWTDLATDEVFQGRRTIAVATPVLPVFARNGTIVPLDSAGGMALHYFPSLAAEFFVFEADAGDYSQMHAAPAADIMRLEIESKKERDYQWVVHHAARPREVGFEGKRFLPVASMERLGDRTWLYDSARRNLHVRVRAAAGEDSIINLTF